MLEYQCHTKAHRKADNQVLQLHRADISASQSIVHQLQEGAASMHTHQHVLLTGVFFKRLHEFGCQDTPMRDVGGDSDWSAHMSNV
jgi:hypothetical protein